MHRNFIQRIMRALSPSFMRALSEAKEGTCRNVPRPPEIRHCRLAVEGALVPLRKQLIVGCVNLAQHIFDS